ncbi:MAG: phosphotransferase [Chloroflexota bacterium]|nr:phosphotransferase [Chloroflexota bacterium]
MMKLSAMLRVDGVIDEEGHSPIAERVLERWEHDPGAARFYRSSANFVYTFLKDDERHFLRFGEQDERSEAAISAEVALLRWLDSQGVDVAAPVASRQGRWVETVATNLGIFHAVVFPQLRGIEMEIENLSAGQFEEWGTSLGWLHTTIRQWHDPQMSARPLWSDYLALARGVGAHDARVQAEYEYLARWLAALPQTEETYGLIHGDFELDNLFWRDDSIVMLDFDDCMRCWYVADIAFALRDLFAAGVDLGDPSLRAFLHGYARHAALDEERVAQLPTWLRVVNLIMDAKLTRAMDLTPNPDQPEWMNALLVKLRQRQDDYWASLPALPR